jgi:cobaltochelatase CobS
MARTPTHTRDEAEAILGRRGTIMLMEHKEITQWAKENKPMLCKWLTAQGMLYQAAACLSYVELGKAYHDTSDQSLEKVFVKYNEGKRDAPEPDDGELQREIERLNEELAKARTQTPAPDHTPSTKGNVLVEAIKDIVGETGVNADAVRDIVRKELEGKEGRTIKINILDKTKEMEMRPHFQTEMLAENILNGVNTLIVGPSQSGKTTAFEHACAMLGQERWAIQGACSGEHQIFGHTDGAGMYHPTPTFAAFTEGFPLCYDEMDSYAADALLANNAITANGYGTFADSPLPKRKHPDFRVVGIANTFGRGADRMYVGRGQLDEATLQRYVVIEWEYDRKLEESLCANRKWLEHCWSIREAAQKEKARLLVSTRTITNGDRLLAMGRSWSHANDSAIWKGFDKEARARIEHAAR